MTQSEQGREFSRPFEVAQVGMTARIRHITADEEERTALAERFDLLALHRLEAEVAIKGVGRDSVVASGTLIAEVEQACVVSLEPVPARLEISFSRRFEPGAPDPNLFDGDLESLLSEEDPPDPIDDGIIDLGELVAEELALSLDPYPRAPDARIPPEWQLSDEEIAKDNEASARPNPFAVLKGGREA